MNGPRIGSLFSGIGGLELGLERGTGGRTVFQVESDPYARAVLAKHWPDVPRFDDVRTVGAHNLPTCDVLVGGFPCQDISNAGKRVGIGGSRSGLWSEFARIIGETSPTWVIIENVSALVGRGLSTVLGDLASLGYDAEWTCLRASDVGAPHLRERLFIVAYASGTRLEGTGDVLASADLVRQTDNQRKSNRAEHDEASGVSGASGHPWAGWENQPELVRVDDGIPPRVDRIRCLGNAVVPQVAEVIGRCIR